MEEEFYIDGANKKQRQIVMNAYNNIINKNAQELDENLRQLTSLNQEMRERKRSRTFKSIKSKRRKISEDDKDDSGYLQNYFFFTYKNRYRNLSI